MDELRRSITEGVVRLRAARDGQAGPGGLVGTAVAFETLSRDLGGYREVIDAHAFDESFAEQVRVLCRGEHDSRALLGTTSAGTLRLTLSERGVDYDVDLPDTTSGRDAAVLAERGDLAFSSFAFRELDGGWDVRADDDGFVWRVRKAQLVDVAPVADPAYWTSSVAKRDIETARALLAERTNPAGDQPAEQDPDIAGLALRDATAARLRQLSNREEC